MQLSGEAFALHVPGVMDAPEQIRTWLIETMAAKAWSPPKWASKAGVAASTIQRAIKPEYQFVTSSRTLSKLAAAAGVTPPAIAPQPVESGQFEATFLSIRYEVGAGMWRKVEDLSEAYGTAPVMADPAYKSFPQWLERVVSDSMDLEYPVGSLLHVVDAVSLHYSVRHGDHVIIQRTRQAGRYIERTVKEVVATPRGLEFWGRSSNPKWNRPATLFDLAHDDDETVEVSIAALVLGSYRPRRP